MPSAQSVLAGSPCSERWLLPSSCLWCWNGVCSEGAAGDLLTSLRTGSLALDQKALHLQPLFSLGVLLMVPKVNTAVTSSRWPGGTGFRSPVELLGPQAPHSPWLRPLCCRAFPLRWPHPHPAAPAGRWGRALLLTSFGCLLSPTLSARPGLDWPVSPPPPSPCLFILLALCCIISCPQGWRVVQIPRPQVCPGHPRSRRCLTGCGRVSSGHEAV